MLVVDFVYNSALVVKVESQFLNRGRCLSFGGGRAASCEAGGEEVNFVECDSTAAWLSSCSTSEEMASFQNSETREEGSNFGTVIGALLPHSTLLCVDFSHVLCPLCKKEQPLTIIKEKKL